MPLHEVQVLVRIRPAMEEVVIVGGARTPFCEWQGGKRGDGQPGGLLKDYSALKLGEIAIKGALEKTSTSPNDVDHVVMGYALQTCDQAIFGAGAKFVCPQDIAGAVEPHH